MRDRKLLVVPNSLPRVQVPQDLQDSVLMGLQKVFSNTRDWAPGPAHQVSVSSAGPSQKALRAARGELLSHLWQEICSNTQESIFKISEPGPLLSQHTLSGCTKSCCSCCGKSGPQRCASWWLSAGQAVSHPCLPLGFAQHTNKCSCADMLIYRQDGDEEHLHLFPRKKYPFGLVSACQAGPATLVWLY